MKKFKVLISDKIEEACIDIFKENNFEVVVETGLKPEELKKIIHQFDALVVRSATQVTADLLSKAENLKVVGRAGAGVDNIDIAAATNHNIIVMNTPGQNSNAAAELAIGLLFVLARNLFPACAAMKSCRWEKKGLAGIELNGKTLGVIGYGSIGRRVGTMAQGIGMRVLGYDPYISPENIQNAGAEAVLLEDLIEKSDFITLHVPKTPETEYIINAKSLAKMKNTAYLINCARGGLVDEKALYQALKNNEIAGAAFDVFEIEPPGNHPLLEFSNFVSTPHLGASTAEAQVNVAVAVAEQIVKLLKDGVCVNALNS